MITVALATYRRPEGLQQALDALASQGFNRLRVIVSDDDPSDDARRRVEADQRLHLTYLARTPRRGVLRNHLSMMPEVTSDLFMFHGDDDALLPDALCQLSEPLKAALGYDAVFANYLKGPTPAQARCVAIADLPFVRYWRHRRRSVRMLAYYLCPAFLGKQNLFYGLFRTEAARRIDLDKAIPARSHHLNLDEMFSFQAVCNGPVLVIGQSCFFFAEGNAKHYQDAPGASKGSLGALVEFVRYEWLTLFDYLRNVQRGQDRLLILLLFPLKFATAMVWRYGRWFR